MPQGTEIAPRPADRRRTCEICGTTAATAPRELAGDGTSVRATLCARHGRQLEVVVQKWLVAQTARTVPHAGQQTGRRLRDGESMQTIREWALSTGYQIARSGSLSHAVMAEYRASHPADVPGRSTTD